MKYIASDFSEVLSNKYSIEDLKIPYGGIRGYLVLWFKLMVISRSKVAICHYGLTGFVASLTGRKYFLYLHGSDLWNPRIRVLTVLASLRAEKILVASEAMLELLPKMVLHKIKVLPIPVRTDLLCQNKLSYKRKNQIRRVLFAGSFDRAVKGPSLALESVGLMENIELIEFKNVEINDKKEFLLNFDALLITSLKESGPLIFLEALCVGLPVVTVDVGLVREFEHEKTVFIVERNPECITIALEKAFAISERKDLFSKYRLRRTVDYIDEFESFVH